MHVDLEPGRADVVDEARQVGEPGRRCVLGAPSSSRSTPSRRRISVSVDRLVAEIASSDFFASAGSVSMTCAPTPACTAITPIEWATTSCSSCAMRSRSSATRALGLLVALALERRVRAPRVAPCTSRRLRIVDPKKYAAAKIAMFAAKPVGVEAGRADDTERQRQAERQHADADVALARGQYAATV